MGVTPHPNLVVFYYTTYVCVCPQPRASDCVTDKIVVWICSCDECPCYPGEESVQLHTRISSHGALHQKAQHNILVPNVSSLLNSHTHTHRHTPRGLNRDWYIVVLQGQVCGALGAGSGASISNTQGCISTNAITTYL